ncbi:unnamed protein product [Closterium sp. Naga37s-1]|nr:unnamed protein product [Closterium sp. Naga37s-1]
MDALSAPFMPLEAAPDGRKGKGKKRREAAEAPNGASDADAKRAKQADAEQQGGGDGGGEAAQPLGESEEQAQTQAVQFVGLRSVRRSKEQQKGREREKRERYAGAGAKAGGEARVGGGKQRRKKAVKSSVVYLGRLPHGFYEDELHGFLSQFGEIEQLRVVRNPKTGRSRHYGYVKFAAPEVAAIVAECMDNYLLFGHLLKTHLVPATRADRDQLFYTPHKNPSEVSQPKPVETWEDYSEQARKQSKKLNATMKRLKAAGIQYDFQPKPKAARPEGGMHQRFNEEGEAAPTPTLTPTTATATATAAGAAAGKGKGAKQTGGAKEQKQKRKGKVEGKVDGQGEKSAEDAEGTQEQERKGVKEVQVQAEGGDGLAEKKVSSGGVSEVTVEGEEKRGGEEDVVARAQAVAQRLKQEAEKFAQVLGKDAVDAEDGGAHEGGAGEDDDGAEAVDEPWSDGHEEEEELLHEEQDVEEEEDEQSEDSEGEEGDED